MLKRIWQLFVIGFIALTGGIAGTLYLTRPYPIDELALAQSVQRLAPGVYFTAGGKCYRFERSYHAQFQIGSEVRTGWRLIAIDVFDGSLSTMDTVDVWYPGQIEFTHIDPNQCPDGIYVPGLKTGTMRPDPFKSGDLPGRR